MGRKENIKRMKKLREQKQLRQTSEAYQREMANIAEEAKQTLKKKLSPFQTTRQNTGPVKYSDVLSSFVKPYMSECRNFSETRGLYLAGSSAWNVAVTKQVAGEKEYEKVMQEAKRLLEHESLIKILQELVARKLKHFADIRILFSDVVLTENEAAYGVSVAVTELK